MGVKSNVLNDVGIDSNTHGVSDAVNSMFNDNSLLATSKDTVIKTKNIKYEDILESKYDEFSKERVDALSESIKENGLQEPLVVYKNEDKKYVIISGHTRYRAITKLRNEGGNEATFESIPCAVKNFIPENEIDERFYLALHNQSREKTNRDRLLDFNSYNDYYEAHKDTIGQAKGKFLASNMGVSREIIRRYIVVTSKLIKDIYKYVENDEISIQLASKIGTKSEDIQKLILQRAKNEKEINVDNSIAYCIKAAYKFLDKEVTSPVIEEKNNENSFIVSNNENTITEDIENNNTKDENADVSHLQEETYIASDNDNIITDNKEEKNYDDSSFSDDEVTEVSDEIMEIQDDSSINDNDYDDLAVIDNNEETFEELEDSNLSDNEDYQNIEENTEDNSIMFEHNDIDEVIEDDLSGIEDMSDDEDNHITTDEQQYIKIDVVKIKNYIAPMILEQGAVAIEDYIIECLTKAANDF